jgi:hypothetical protein
MKVYISGPMSGYPDYNRPAFHKAAEELRAQGHEPLNPAELDLGEGATWQEYMRADIRMLTYADAIYLLDGWEASRGATFEKYVADTLGIPVFRP